ncbi:MAG TPA: GNAT family N-acyltransferase [Anaeromyxobacter sp.]|nr:GNAT family N-acyltransferase [Anaeromyxobacter sp.]
MNPTSLQVLELESGGKEERASEEGGAYLRSPAAHPHGLQRPERIHGAVDPADVHPGDPVEVHLGVPGRHDRPVPSRVSRISPLGVELVRPRELSGVRAGTAIDLTLRIGTSVSDFRSVPVLATAREHGDELLALRFEARRPSLVRGEQRGASRWVCLPEYPPTGIAPNAVRYEDFVYFRVVDVSWSGMQLETSLRNKFLVPGVELESTCTFPTLGQVHLVLRIVHARVINRGDKQVLGLGVKYSSRSRAAVDTIGQYLLRFGSGPTVQELCAEGFRIRFSSRSLDFCSIRTEEEYREVLRLRRLAYVHSRKVSADAKDVDMADSYDRSSRILVAKHRGRVVGTARLMFPRSEGERLNHEDFLDLPPGLPPRQELVEVFKTCTHPGYRGSDVFYTLLMHVGLNILQSGRRYALMSATDSLAPIYERFGFRRVGVSYQHPAMRLRHHLMILDVGRVVAGRGINPLFWNLVGGWDLWNFGKLCGIVAIDPWTVVRVRLWRLLRPAAEVARVLVERKLRAPAAPR